MIMQTSKQVKNKTFIDEQRRQVPSLRKEPMKARGNSGVLRGICPFGWAFEEFSIPYPSKEVVKYQLLKQSFAEEEKARSHRNALFQDNLKHSINPSKSGNFLTFSCLTWALVCSKNVFGYSYR